jgi:UDP-glucose 4-epimerase
MRQAGLPMLEHMRNPPADPKRAVVLGAGGFVGGSCMSLLRGAGIDALPLTRQDIDLLSTDAVAQLSERLLPTDSLVVISARAPCKNAVMLRENIAMMETVCSVLVSRPVDHVVYVSSDAVYGDEPAPLTESSPAAPGSLHGVMHLAREIMLREAVNGPLAVLRPTLIYGARDPHNGYGPNRFRRQASEGQDIVLFGEGEELRDHVIVDDVAEIILRVLRARSVGTLNIATGTVTSFRDIADTIVSMFERKVAVKPSRRVGSMPHNGYRPFDPSATRAAFPDFTYTPLSAGLAQSHAEALRGNHG